MEKWCQHSRKQQSSGHTGSFKSAMHTSYLLTIKGGFVCHAASLGMLQCGT